jgi:hypothetical protein
MTLRPTYGTPAADVRPARTALIEPGPGVHRRQGSPVDDERTPVSEPDRTPVSTEHQRGSVRAVRRGTGVVGCHHRCSAGMMPTTRRWRPHPNPYGAALRAGRNQRTSADLWRRPPARVSYRRLHRGRGDPPGVTSSCSAASSSSSAAWRSAACSRWAAISNRHHRCSMTHTHTAAATTTTAAADHQYATRAARTGTPTLARIGCRSTHDRPCMSSR